MNIFLLDIAETWLQLLPLTYTRPIGDIRVGILKISEKWSMRLNSQVTFITEPYLSKTQKLTQSDPALIINGALLPDNHLVAGIENLSDNQMLVRDGKFLACRSKSIPTFNDDIGDDMEKVEHPNDVQLIERPWDIFLKNGYQIRLDFDLITMSRESEEIKDPHTITYAKENIFLEEGVQVKACTLNAENGPIYLGRNSKVHEGAVIRGPFALGEFSHVNVGAKIRGDSTFGPHCKVGGEVANTVIFGYSSKAHEGYLGNSVIGEWCNIGADTNTSNLKNNYTNVKVWDYGKEGFYDSKLQFCGLIMGDHAKCGINTMFNTGTVVGVSANIFGPGFPRTMIPSFSWGGASGFTTYTVKKAKETALKVMERRAIQWTNDDDQVFQEIFDRSSKFRVWENNKAT